MIALNRTRTASAVKAKYRGVEKRKRDKELMLARLDVLRGIKTKIKFKESYWKAAKTQLKKETFGKCAYCEANTDIVAHGDVEHFRPKGIYWWLAYTYDNYLYSCQICNQSYKGDNFPIGGNKLPEPVLPINMTSNEIEQMAGCISPDPLEINQAYTLQHFLDSILAETSHLINPYFDNPETYFAYEADETTEEVRLIPAKQEYAIYAQAAEDYFGLNRIELKNNRYKTYRLFRTFKVVLSELPDGPIKQDVLKQIEDMKSGSYVFAGMNRFFDAVI